MDRRAFITVIGGSMLAGSLPAEGQQAELPRIGYLSARSPEDTSHLVAAFRMGLNENDFVEGKNVTIEYRWALGQYDRLPALAAELTRRPLAVIVTTGGETAALAAKAATSTIPIVFALGTDPIKLGLVASYNRPGGNVTGINILTTTLEAKRLGLLHELVPGATTIGFLLNPNFTSSTSQLREAQDAASVLGLRLDVLRANTDREIDTAFDSVAKRHIAALVMAAGPFFDTRREKLVGLAARHSVPTIYPFHDYAEAGGLMSYGIDLPDAYRQLGVYAARILKGAKPAELPVIQPSKFELVINMKTAKTLGLTIPQTVLLQADQVID